MRNFLLLLASVCMGSGPLFAQSFNYMSLIPDSLKKDADVVTREESSFFKVKDINDATLQVHEVVTVMNPDGKSDLAFHYTSDKFSYLDDAEIKVYNAMGIKLNTYTKKEMHLSGYGEGLVEDGKTTWFEVTAASYPITIEKNYSIRYRGTLFYPQYIIQKTYQSVQQSQFTVEVPNSLGMHYRCLNSAPAPQVQPGTGTTTYTWKVANLPAHKSERSSGSFLNYLPYVQLAPNRFQMDDYAGDMSSWKEFGRWYASLVGNSNVLSDERKAFFANLVKDAATDRQKAEIIYHYLQQNMRYVSIQLGIGGWKPFAASFVDTKKYGDCKALSNYMQAALAAVGVKAYSTIIFSDDRVASRMKAPLSEDFPVNQFNHVVVCIPQSVDSIWLECTSTTTGFGEMTPSTLNRKALLVTENGGVLVPTPASQPGQNRTACHTDIQLAEDGSGKVATVLNTTGTPRQMQLYYLTQTSADEKNKLFTDGLEWKHPDALQINAGDKSTDVFAASASMQYEKIPQMMTGSKMFLPVRLYALANEEVPDNPKRTQDYFFSFPHQNVDTTVYHLPAGFAIAYKPEDKNLAYSFGSYNSRYFWDTASQTLTVVARYEIAQSLVKAADYQQLSAFSKAVAADTNEKIVIKKM
jgi:transglutaminase-like putative cysteine protease